MALTIPSINNLTVKAEDKRSDENLSKTGMRIRSDWICRQLCQAYFEMTAFLGYVPLGKGRRQHLMDER